MSGSSIAAEAATGIKEAAISLSDGGFSIALIQGASQPVNPWDIDTSEPTRTNVTGVVQNYPRGQIDGTLIRAEDRKVMVAATGPRPTVADKLEIEGVTYSIEGVRETGPGGVPLYYEVQARK